jgi:hypothetical protein
VNVIARMSLGLHPVDLIICSTRRTFQQKATMMQA